MRKSALKIGNAQAFWGDSPKAASQLLHQQPDLDYLTLDYLSEVSLSIMAIQRQKEASTGYAKDFVQVIEDLIPFWQQGYPCKVISNAGGLNPFGCAQACAARLKQLAPELRLKIAVTTGDDVLHHLKEDSQRDLYRNLETRQNLTHILDRLVTANAYLGAQSIAEALLQNAQLVITGRVADPSLTVGPCLAHFGWNERAWDAIAGATVAGHLIECGTQVTGGMTTNWLLLKDQFHIPFPVVEIAEDGSCVVTKPKKSGGAVTLQTVKEQLLYEIGDPDHYLSPDVTLSLLQLQLQDLGQDRVQVTGAKGRPPPQTYKVSATYRDGFKVEGMIAIYGPKAIEKAELCGQLLLKRMQEAGLSPERSNIACIGGEGIMPLGQRTQAYSGRNECMLRICLADSKEQTLEYFSRELASLVTCGPQGVTGYSSGRPHIRPIFGYWPCLIPRDLVTPHVQIIEV